MPVVGALVAAKAAKRVSKKGVDFIIRKNVTDNFIIKTIDVKHNDQVHHYMEKVQALDLDKMKLFAEASGLRIKEIFGDYDLNPFNKNHSDRLILLMQ